MGMFVRVTLVVAAAIVTFAVLIMLLKLLVVAAVLATLAIGAAFVVRSLRRRIGPRSRARVTALTARR